MMSSSQNRATDKHIIWSDINLNPDDWRDNYKDFLEINEIDGDPNDEHILLAFMQVFPQCRASGRSGVGSGDTRYAP